MLFILMILTYQTTILITDITGIENKDFVNIFDDVGDFNPLNHDPNNDPGDDNDEGENNDAGDDGDS